MTADAINGLFEFIGGAFLLLNCRQMYRDKHVAGVSIWPFLFYSVWGFWNLYFYPHVGAMWSFYGGLFVVVVNTIWVAMALHYRQDA